MGNLRQSVAFPTVAYIRKGTPKRIMLNKDKKEYEAMGKDLKNKFRIEFLSGTDFKRENGKPSIREVWHSLHAKDYVKYGDKFVTPDGYEVEYIRAMIPTAKVMDGWEWSNKTYNGSGMLIASADGERYITKKDPLTMELLVKRGEPYTKFEYGDAINYENEKGKKISLKLKSSGRLKLFIPEMGEFVSFELRTTSYIDSLNIEQNLRAIQQIADAINGGMAGGIPLDIYRIEVDVPYFSDGKSHKSKQWFIQIKANSEWANSAIARLNSYAMGVPALQAPIPFSPPELPQSAIEDDDDDEGESPEKIIRENVSEGVVTEENIYDQITKLCKEKGGRKNKELTDLLKSYGNGGNFKTITDNATLEKLIKEIKKLKETK
jgi:hypothetical protein